MEKRMIEITYKKNKHIKLGIIPGHFATNHSHVNYYVDLNKIKRSYKTAHEAASEIASRYSGTEIDTIVCLEGTQMLGGLIAQALTEGSLHSLNHGNDINVLIPEMDSNNQMIFRDDTQEMIWNKRILLLISSASTGWTIDRCIECFKYYSGNLVSVSALFSAITETNGIPVTSLFSPEDIHDYQSNIPSECPMCKEKKRVDALVNAFGYSKF